MLPLWPMPGNCSRPTLLGRCPRLTMPAVPAGILFPADPDQAGILFPAVPAGILFPADPAGILIPAVPAGIPISADPAGILFPADLAELDSVGVVDVAVAGEAPLTVPDVFDGPELVAMIVADEVETVEGIPVDYGGDYDDSDYKDPRNEFETVDGMPVYYGGDFNNSDCEDPVILLTKIVWIGVILTLRMDIVGFSRMTGKPSCLLLIVHM